MSHAAQTPDIRLPFVTAEHELFRRQVRRFVEERVKPAADRWEEDGLVPRDILRSMGELGMLGVRYPTQYGGANWDAVASVILAEELGRSTYGGFAITVLTQTDTASPHVASVGSAAQKERYLPGIVRGEIVVAIAITEPGAGSDVSSIRASAVREGDTLLVNGTKMFITNGVQADLFVVAVRTNPALKATRGISLVLIEKGTPGLSVGRKLDKMGWRSSDTAEIVFEQCRVPMANVLGEVDRGFYTLMRNIQNERLVLAGQALGEAAAALELTVRYVRERAAFGGRLWDKQAIRQRLAMLSARLTAARHLAYDTAWAYAQGADCVKEVSMVKALCGELVNDVMYDCLQFHGGYGVMRESPIERMYRDARVHSIGGGATEVMLEEIAKRMHAGAD